MRRPGFVNSDLCKGVLTVNNYNNNNNNNNNDDDGHNTGIAKYDMRTITAPSESAKLESERLLRIFEDTRKTTLSLVSTLEPDDYTVQTAPYTSPAKWHIGHVSWIYEAIMGKIDPAYGFEEGEVSSYLNSYYQQFGKPHEKGSRGIVSRPTTTGMLEYFEGVSQKVEKFISENADTINGTDDHNNTSAVRDGAEISRLLEMGVHHECQHQELLVYDLQHMLADRYEPPIGANMPAVAATKHDVSGSLQVRIEGGIYHAGYGGSRYCYDIELPEHKVYLEPYIMDTYPVTNKQYMKFIEDGGYDDYKYWLSDGWEAVGKNGWEAPMYWEKNSRRYMAYPRLCRVPRDRPARTRVPCELLRGRRVLQVGRKEAPHRGRMGKGRMLG